MQINKIGSLSYTIQKINIMINHLNVRSKTIKFLEENIDVKLLDINLGDSFLDLILKVMATKANLITSETKSN